MPRVQSLLLLVLAAVACVVAVSATHIDPRSDALIKQANGRYIGPLPVLPSAVKIDKLWDKAPKPAAAAVLPAGTSAAVIAAIAAGQVPAAGAVAGAAPFKAADGTVYPTGPLGLPVVPIPRDAISAAVLEDMKKDGVVVNAAGAAPVAAAPAHQSLLKVDEVLADKLTDMLRSQRAQESQAGTLATAMLELVHAEEPAAPTLTKPTVEVGTVGLPEPVVPAKRPLDTLKPCPAAQATSLLELSTLYRLSAESEAESEESPASGLDGPYVPPADAPKPTDVVPTTVDTPATPATPSGPVLKVPTIEVGTVGLPEPVAAPKRNLDNLKPCPKPAPAPAAAPVAVFLELEGEVTADVAADAAAEAADRLAESADAAAEAKDEPAAGLDGPYVPPADAPKPTDVVPTTVDTPTTPATPSGPVLKVPTIQVGTVGLPEPVAPPKRNLDNLKPCPKAAALLEIQAESEAEAETEADSEGDSEDKADSEAAADASAEADSTEAAKLDGASEASSESEASSGEALTASSDPKLIFARRRHVKAAKAEVDRGLAPAEHAVAKHFIDAFALEHEGQWDTENKVESKNGINVGFHNPRVQANTWAFWKREAPM